ncbi:type VII secretion-associated serine protease mycosin [Micromonospora pattaloongensis]|nr:type VII secretion-associated serine protease mycosin [Micromonospora pattaloongensis]
MTLRYAAPACSSRPAPVPPSTEVPWAQQRYAPERLTPLATGRGITVAVIDSGVDDEHPQLRGRVLPGNDFLDGGDGTLDCDGHGTAVASIIAAGPARVPFRGLAPGARILPVRVSEQQIIGGRESGRTVTATQFAEAIRWAVDHDADVLNLSVVLYEDHPAVRSAVEYAVAEDVVVVAAAGNLHENGDPRPYPAAYDSVLGVGAIGADGSRQQYSQVGSYVDVVAPGGGVLAAAPGRGHAAQDGTSYAAPFVSATAALIRDYRPELRAGEVVQRIVSTTDPAPGGRRSPAYGTGVLNPYRAVTETRPVGRPEPPAPLAPERMDPAAVAQQERRAQSRDRSLLLAALGGGVAGLAVLLALVLPRGVRRRWRPAGPADPQPAAGRTG